MNHIQMKPLNPKFTLEYKQAAEKLVNEKVYTHQQAADNLGVSLSAIGTWSWAESPPYSGICNKESNLEPDRTQRIDPVSAG
ncbi:MAG: hypothetical protein IPN42_16205 [Methylococcaceae bacterium]|nr:hypothetical protein [Methylococcaceae bacterium]